MSHLIDEILCTFSLSMGTRKRSPLLLLLFNMVLQAIAPGEEIKGIQIRNKEDIKYSLFTDDIIVYIEDPKEPANIVLELINEVIKVTGYKCLHPPPIHMLKS